MFRAALKLSIPILICVIVLPAVAGEGRIPIWQYPTSITQAGKYIVTRDIINPGGAPQPIIDIQVASVDIDINGFTLDNSGSPAPVINIADDVVDVVIRNGFLVGGTHSIERSSAASTEGQRVVIEDIQTRKADGTSIHLWEVREVAIRRVNILDPGVHGIHIDRNTGFTNGIIEHCTIRLNIPSTDGIHIDRASSLAVRHNRIETPGLHGIHLMDSYAVLVGENTISDADGIAVHLENTKGCKIYNNVISRGEQHGIRIDPGSWENLLMENTVRESGWAGNPAPGIGGGHGFLIEGDVNYLEGNTAIRNDACGFIFVGNDNTFGRNMARRNDPGLVGWCAPCVALPTPDYCDTIGSNHSRTNNMAAGALPF
jgi:parallel beta-helix repeat protein